MQSILIAVENETLLTFLGDNLTADRFEVFAHPDRDELERVLSNNARDFDVAVIDEAMARGGLLRAYSDRTPFVVLVASDSEVVACKMFHDGARDVMKKPLAYEELVCRLKVITSTLRPVKRTLTWGDLQINLDERWCQLDGDPLALSSKEYHLLAALADDPNRVFTKEELMRKVWGTRLVGSSRTLDSHACRLRAKLIEASGSSNWVTNVWGVGYRLADPVGA